MERRLIMLGGQQFVKVRVVEGGGWRWGRLQPTLVVVVVVVAAAAKELLHRCCSFWVFWFWFFFEPEIFVN